MDVKCAQCGKSWDLLGVAEHQDMTAHEAARFSRDEGCPCCEARPAEHEEEV